MKTLDDVVADVEAKAAASGPEAVAEIEALRVHYRGVAEWLLRDDTFTLPTEAGPKTVRLIEPRRSARCQHRDPADPLPCPVPSCSAGHRCTRLAVVFADVAEDGSDGRVGSFRAVRRLDESGRWVWRPAGGAR